MTLTHEGSAALRAADPTANFEAVLASAEAKNISGPLSARIKSSLSKPETSRGAKPSSTKQKKMDNEPVEHLATCTYTIKSGDTLAKIASKQLGNANLWTRIRDLNKTVIKNPNALRVGQVIELPCGAGGSAPVKREPIWKAKRGSDFDSVIRRWAKSAGYRVIKKSNAIWTIDVDVHIQGSFEQSIQDLIKGMANGGRPPGVKIYSNKILEIS